MGVANLFTYKYLKRKKLTVIIYLIILCAIVTINVLFLLAHQFALNYIAISFFSEIMLLILSNIVAVSISFVIVNKMLQKRYNDVAASLLTVLKQFEKGNFTYPFSIDNGRFDNVLRYMQKLMMRQNSTPASFDEKLNERVFEIITVLISAMEDKDPYTSGHTTRVAHYALAIGKRLGLSQEKMRLLNHAAAAHDIGKIGIPIEIIEKNGRLNEKEKLMMESHPIRGMKILSSIDYLEDIASIIMYHHERADGKGYYQLPGEKVPVEAKIIAVADALDAMLSDRPYRKALSLYEAKQEILKNKGTQFDPEVVDALINVLEEKEPLKEFIAF
ncbi:MAG TPA: HD-GYP domain-containing protein [Spirochaetota bacterium]|nr:HD-GYP domain-containing protein [Spirochaetota bacterium]HOM08935.1 HD-GYP domain-containing protein [Spirochaetota bacterium]HPP48872.1 HD-GYP domain-containing protein [Spirochaetota bacterium]HXK65236.1 HD-GYP domain-containing protein [Spirochaetota bacterium]